MYAQLHGCLYVLDGKHPTVLGNDQACNQWGQSLPYKIFAPLEKCTRHNLLKLLDIHNSKLKKFGPLLEHSTPFLVFQAGYRPRNDAVGGKIDAANKLN